MAVTRTPRTENPGVVPVSKAAGEHLHFTLDAGGPVPIFSFVSSVKGVLWEALDFQGHPLKRYEWDHLRNPSDIQQLEELTLRLAFFSNAEYTYKVELVGATRRTVLEITYKGDATDSYPESFTVVIVP